jgi:hypothetical protein
MHILPPTTSRVKRTGRSQKRISPIVSLLSSVSSTKAHRTLSSEREEEKRDDLRTYRGEAMKHFSHL